MRQESLVAKSTAFQSGMLVRHAGAGRAEELHGRVVEEVRDPGRVQIGVVLDLLAEARIFVAFLENEPPVGIGAGLETGLQLSRLEQRRLEGAAQLFQVLLLALAARLDLRRQRPAALD